MPEIPLYNGGRSTPRGPIPQMPLDHLGRPRADFSGIIAGLGRVSQGQEALVKASAPPLLDPNMFDGLEKGQQALGKAVGDIGSLIEAFAKKRQQVIDQRDSNRATDALTAAKREHQSTRDASRPETWGTTLGTRLGAVADSLVGDKNLSPEARETIQVQARQYVNTSVTEAETEGIENLWNQVVDRHFAEVERESDAGNYDAVMHAVTLGVANHYFDERTGVAWLLKTRARGNELQRAKDLAERPAQVSFWLENPAADGVPEAYATLGPVQLTQLKEQAQTALATREMAAMQAAKKALLSGAIRGAAEAVRLPELRALGDVPRMEGVVKRVQELEKNPAGDPAAFLHQYAAVAAARSTPLGRPGDELRWQQLRVLNEAFPGPQTQILHQTLDAAAASRPSLSDEALDYGRRSIVALFDQGMFDLDPPPEPAPTGLPDLAARPDTPSGTLVPTPGREGAPTLASPRSAERPFSLIREIEQLAVTSGSPLTQAQVDRWIDQNTVPEQRHARAMTLFNALSSFQEGEAR